jgi:hypothetical protein
MLELTQDLLSLQATAWVRNMTGGADFDAEEEAALPDSAEPEVRPIRFYLPSVFHPTFLLSIMTFRELQNFCSKFAPSCCWLLCIRN